MSPPGAKLDSYSLLGRSGLRVSPLSIGTMTFGTDWGWGSPDRAVLATEFTFASSPGDPNWGGNWRKNIYRALEASLQLDYSLLERNIEREHIPAAIELGAGICPWSPLASGMLTGKYSRQGNRAAGEGRLATFQDSGNPAFEQLLSERSAAAEPLWWR